MSEFDDVRAFHERFGLLHPVTPGHLTGRKLAERANFMLEELMEFAKAAGLTTNVLYFADVICGRHRFEFVPMDDGDQNLDGQADALVDLVYVALGTAVQMGLPWTKLWDDVHRANMTKVRGASDRAHVDVVKPPGWQPPRTAEILDEAGYQRSDVIRFYWDDKR